MDSVSSDVLHCLSRCEFKQSNRYNAVILPTQVCQLCAWVVLLISD
jgi:hypothetical protein